MCIVQSNGTWLCLRCELLISDSWLQLAWYTLLLPVKTGRLHYNCLDCVERFVCMRCSSIFPCRRLRSCRLNVCVHAHSLTHSLSQEIGGRKEKLCIIMNAINMCQETRFAFLICFLCVRVNTQCCVGKMYVGFVVWLVVGWMVAKCAGEFAWHTLLIHIHLLA